MLQQTTNNKQQTTNNKQQTTNNKQQTTKCKKLLKKRQVFYYELIFIVKYLFFLFFKINRKFLN
jgi:hypothetical protein